MAKVSQEPPSPVDAYEAPPTPFAAGETAPPAPAGVPRAAAISNGAPAELNVLAVIALIASCFGLTIPGIVMGHIALSQINKSGESGHGLALAAVIVGYALTVLVIIAVAVFLLFLFAIISVAGSAVSDAGTFG